MPLGRLPPDRRAAIDAMLRETLERNAVLARARLIVSGTEEEESAC
jgi:hypothetical protein